MLFTYRKTTRYRNDCRDAQVFMNHIRDSIGIPGILYIESDFAVGRKLGDSGKDQNNMV
jgi:hypothetical protein